MSMYTGGHDHHSCGSQVIGVVQKWIKERHCEYWNQTEGLRHSKITLRRPSPGLQKSLTNLNRREVRIATGLITGHCGLRTSTFGLWQSLKETQAADYTELKTDLQLTSFSIVRH